MNKNKFASLDETALSDASAPAVSAAPAVAMPTLKSAKAAAVLKVLVPVVLVALPTIAGFVPAITPFIGAINALAKMFGYGV